MILSLTSEVVTSPSQLKLSILDRNNGWVRVFCKGKRERTSLSLYYF